MARLDLGSGSSGYSFRGSGRRGGSRKKKDDDLLALARELGWDKEVDKAKEPKDSFLTKIGKVTDALRQAGTNAYANLAGMEQTKDDSGFFDSVVKGFKGEQEINTADILEHHGMGDETLFKMPVLGKDISARDIAGFAGDVVLDPLNLIGVGVAGKAAKLAGKAGDAAVHLNKAGQAAQKSHIDDAIRNLGKTEDVARKEFADLVRQSPEMLKKYEDLGGIKVAGKTVVKGRDLAKGYGKLEAIPGIGKVATGVREGGDEIANLFQKGLKAKRAGGEDVVNALSIHKSGINAAHDAGQQLTKEFQKIVKKAKPATLSFDEADQALRRAIEEPDKYMEDWMSEPIRVFREKMDEIHELDDPIFKAVKGEEDWYRENYFPRLFNANKDDVDDILSKYVQANQLDISPSAFEARTFEGSMEDLVNMAREQGVDVKPVGASEAFGARARMSDMTRQKFNTAEELKKLGIEAEDVVNMGKREDPLVMQNFIDRLGVRGKNDLPKEKIYRAGRPGNYFSKSKKYTESGFKHPSREVDMPSNVKLLDATNDYGRLHELATPEELAILNKKGLGPTHSEIKKINQDILERNGYDGMRFLDEDSDGDVAESIFFTDKSSPDFANNKIQSDIVDDLHKKGLVDDAVVKKNKEIINQTNLYQKGYREVKDIPQLKGFKFPKAVAEFIQEEMTKSGGPKHPFLESWDIAMGAWKGAVTTLFPAFHGRNMVGNNFNMWLGGFYDNPLKGGKIQAKVAKEFLRKDLDKLKFTDELGETWTAEKLRKLGVMGGQAEHEANIAQKGLNKLFKPGREIGKRVEDPARIAFFLQQRSLGKSVDEAVAHVNKYLFNYGNQTDTVRKIGRVVPFFTWTANNVPLQVEQLIKQPNKFNRVINAFESDALGVDEELRRMLPEYRQEDLLLGGEQRTDDEGSLIQDVFHGLGLPMQDLNRLDRGSVGRTFEREVMGSLPPGLKQIVEHSMGRDFFRGQDLEDTNSQYAYGVRNYPKFLKDALGYEETEGGEMADGSTYINRSVDPELYKAFEALGLGRLLSTIFPSSEDSSDVIQNLPEIAAKGSLPMSVSDYNLTDEKKKREREMLERIQQLMVEEGILREYTNYYQPSDGKKKKSSGSSVAVR